MVQESRRREYYDLEQGSRTVGEYAKVFSELGRYAPDSFGNEAYRTQDFIKGLKPDLRRGLRVMELTQFKDVVNKAIIAEEELDLSWS